MTSSLHFHSGPSHPHVIWIITMDLLAFILLPTHSQSIFFTEARVIILKYYPITALLCSNPSVSPHHTWPKSIPGPKRPRSQHFVSSIALFLTHSVPGTLELKHSKDTLTLGVLHWLVPLSRIFFPHIFYPLLNIQPLRTIFCSTPLLTNYSYLTEVFLFSNSTYHLLT